jgi:hypothetical protein
MLVVRGAQAQCTDCHSRADSIHQHSFGHNRVLHGFRRRAVCDGIATGTQRPRFPGGLALLTALRSRRRPPQRACAADDRATKGVAAARRATLVARMRGNPVLHLTAVTGDDWPLQA